MSRTAQITMKVIAVEDVQGVLHTVCVEDMSDPCWMCVETNEGNETFEAEAYHLYKWARDLDLRYFEATEVDVEVEVDQID